MHRTIIIFMVLEVGGRGAAGFRIIRNAKDCHHFHGRRWEGGDWLQTHKKCIERSDFSWFREWAGRGRLASVIRNAKNFYHFRGFESARKGGGWLQNHERCMGMLSFSWFGEWAGGGRLGSEKICIRLLSFSCLWKWVGGGRVPPES